MTTQHDERAELIRKLNESAVVFRQNARLFGLPDIPAGELLQEKAAAPLAADGQAGGEVAARPCHVFNVHKSGALTEWEPTTMAFALPDGTHPLYTHPQPQSVAVPADKTQAFYLAVCNFLVWIGREGVVRSSDQIIDQLSNALHEIDGGLFKEYLKWPQAVAQWWKLAKVPADTPDNDWGEPIVYDTNEIDQITHALTGDEGEDDSVTVLHRLVRYLGLVHPGKTMTEVLIETEESRLAASPSAPAAAQAEKAELVSSFRATGLTRQESVTAANAITAMNQPAAQVAQPLTPAQAGALWKVGMTPHEYAQAVEAAHGIGKDQG